MDQQTIETILRHTGELLATAAGTPGLELVVIMSVRTEDGTHDNLDIQTMYSVSDDELSEILSLAACRAIESAT